MPHSFKQLLDRIMSEKAPGPSPTFSVLHMLQAIEIISEKAVGRNRLAQILGVGEGAVRTIIDRLKEADLITTSKAGCTLTKMGSKLLREYESVFEKRVEIERNELTLANYGYAILAKDRAHKVKSGVEQRDAAVMAGAKGATTMMLKKGCLVAPSVSDNVAQDFPKAAHLIVGLLRPEENDVVIIGSADTLGKAKYGALAAALTLL
jgi:Mn-dependent DtxR family transcriptional regulator